MLGTGCQKQVMKISTKGMPILLPPMYIANTMKKASILFGIDLERKKGICRPM